MKILCVTENYYAGGMDKFITMLFNHWPQADHLTLFCNYDHPGIKDIQLGLQREVVFELHKLPTKPRIEFIYQNWFSIFRMLMKFLMLPGQYFLLAWDVIYLYCVIQKGQYERIIICNGGYPAGDTCRAAAIACLLPGILIKPLFIYHNDPQASQPLKVLIEHSIDWLIARSVSFLVTVSEDTQSKMRNRPILFSSGKLKVIYNGIKFLPQLSKDSIKKELGLFQEHAIVLMVGTYEERKGHDFLFKTFLKVSHQLPHVRLLIAGDGYPQDRKRIKELVEKYDLSSKVFLLGFRTDVMSILQETDLLVAPSLRDESFNLCLAEAMSQRVPVIATKIGGMKEVLKDGGGFLVAVNEDRFADQMIELLKNDSLRKQVGNQGYQVYQTRFRVETMVEKYCQLLAQG